ncbi:hypothetical protein LUZ60_013136 [Juncus effusus]|nr:hypothetical protein LUZ60_013136 [Juncus effusus]
MDRAGVVRQADDLAIKSPNDRRSYRILRLPNGLFVVLVHDPEIYSEGFPPPQSEKEGEDDVDMEEPIIDDHVDDDQDDMEEDHDEEDEEMNGYESEPIRKGKKSYGIVKKAAAAMCVGIGHFSDPPNAQGLSHFLEHMLFMGSSEFPHEDEYDSFLAKHGGSSNAFTDLEHTCYFFDVNREFLKGALKSTSPPGHPLNRFLWGNKKSLSDSRINMREEALKMYRDNYHAGIMKLVVIGGEPLEILEDWVVELFSKVKPGPQVETSEKAPEFPIWTAGKLYRLEAVNDLHDLHLTWTLPCLHKEYLKNPDGYLGHILGEEGRGSILCLLKAKGWATSILSGVEETGTLKSSFAYLFSISIRLTDAGLNKMYEVIGVVYQYINLLKQSKPQEWIFKELQDMGNMDFRFVEERAQDDYATLLSENAIIYEEKHIICGYYISEEWDPALVEYVLGFFVPDNMRVDVITKEFNKNCQAVQIEPWFGSRYTEEEIPWNLLEAWRNPSFIDPALHLPLKNEFIPTDFALRNADVAKPTGENNPICIIDQPLIKLWYKMDFTFNVPRANAYFLISVKDGYKSLRNYILTELFVNLLKDELNDVIYQAGVAKLETSITVLDDKIELKLHGFNDKIPALLMKILCLAKSFIPTIDRFKVVKEEMERSYRNMNLEPIKQCSCLKMQFFRETVYDVNDKLNALFSLTLSDLSSFIPHLLSQVYVEGLCHGNLSKDEAINISNIFTSTLCKNAKPLNDDLKHHIKIICLEPGAKLLRSVPIRNELEQNSVVALYCQIELEKGRESLRFKATLDLLADLIRQPFIDRLRTKEQLGAALDCGARSLYFVSGIFFCILSSKYAPSYLQSRIDKFMDGLPAFLEAFSEENLEHHKDGLIADKLEKDPTLTSETANHWYRISSKSYLFDMLKMEAEELRTIRKDDVINLFNTYLRPESPKCKRIAFHICGCDVDPAADVAKLQENNWRLIEDVDSFKQASKFYPWSLC